MTPAAAEPLALPLAPPPPSAAPAKITPPPSTAIGTGKDTPARAESIAVENDFTPSTTGLTTEGVTGGLATLCTPEELNPGSVEVDALAPAGVEVEAGDVSVVMAEVF